VPVDGLTLIQKTAGIFADEKNREQRPAGQIRHRADWLGTHWFRIVDFEIGSGNTRQIVALSVVALSVVELTIVELTLLAPVRLITGHPVK
jgi:hypothetical protein